jgi:UDP-N-acetylmuramoylalanine--D-glutamate ligase
MKYVIYGLGISGNSAARELAKLGFEVIATDDNLANLEKTAKSDLSKEKNIKFLTPEEINFDEKTIISFSPGIPLRYPKQHKIIDICKKFNSKLSCDIEIFYQLNQDNNFIAITGTNGKSTTTALTNFILKDLSISSEMGGNIGFAAFDLPQNKKNYHYVLETSSFQLDLMSEVRFKSAALLDITTDHIDRHGSMQNYIEAKKRIFQNQQESDYAFISIDNENSKKVYSELKNDKNYSAKLIAISVESEIEDGISLIDGFLKNLDGKKYHIRSDYLIGKHNQQNIAFAFAIISNLLREKKIANLEEKIISAISKFRGLKHRMQIIGKIDDINFINDSKATNAESTEKCLMSYDNIFLILGGVAKEGGISILKPYLKKIEKCYLIGKASDEFASFLDQNSVKHIKSGNLKNAMDQSLIDAKESNLISKNIILSPSCASFDQWKNFEERGDFFCNYFNELAKK